MITGTANIELYVVGVVQKALYTKFYLLVDKATAVSNGKQTQRLSNFSSDT